MIENQLKGFIDFFYLTLKSFVQHVSSMKTKHVPNVWDFLIRHLYEIKVPKNAFAHSIILMFIVLVDTSLSNGTLSLCFTFCCYFHNNFMDE